MSIPELKRLPPEERKRVLRAIGPAVHKDPRVWGSYAAQILSFILIFLVLFPTAQPRLVLMLAYILPTVWLAGQMHKRVFREKFVAFLKDNPSA